MKKIRFKPHVKQTAVRYGKRMPQPLTVEMKYKKKLRIITQYMVDDVTKKLLRVFKGPRARKAFAQDALFANEVERVLNELKKKWHTLFNQSAWIFAEGMVRQAEKISATAVAESLKQLSGGFKIKTNFTTGGMKDILKSSVVENVSLIKSIPEQYLQKVEGLAMRTINNGGGVGEFQAKLHEQFESQLKKYGGSTEKRAKFIAEDQTRKVYNSLNAKRFKRAGVQKFEWLHSGGGQTPRPLHEELDGQIFPIDNPPLIQEDPDVYGLPGYLPNCRCTMAPVIEFDDEDDETEDKE